mgnify:CR=1 FL=1
MPKINIKDSDLTTAVGNITNSYGVFVPGFPGVDVTTEHTSAIEYTSLSAFKADFGESPQTLGNNLVDSGYIYACEILGAGLPVVYKVIPLSTTLISTVDTFENGYTAGVELSFNPAGNTNPGTTNLRDELTFRDADDTTVALSADAVVTVNSNKELTIEGISSDSGALTEIKSVVYSYEPEDYVDPETITAKDVSEAILGSSTFFEEITDRGLYDVSFVTLGGYPVVWDMDEDSPKSLASALMSVCETRGDCFALIDLEQEYKFETPWVAPTQITDLGEDALAVVPWIDYTPVFAGTSDNITLPGSFAYLKAFANSIRTNNSWFATAGVRRGVVNCNSVTQTITNAETNALQPDAGTSVNAITYIKPYGFTIYGNRTLINNVETGLVANSFVNIRQLVHDIKRQVYIIARSLMFDPNDDILWVNFKNSITPLLERMRSGQGISSYRLVKVENNTRGTLSAKIIISPIEAVETFNITVELTDESTTVTG